MEISGYGILIDQEDEYLLNIYNYYVQKHTLKKVYKYYFCRTMYINGICTHTLLHRDIMGCAIGDGKVVDHINGNTLDNRKSNLRVCTQAENMRNMKRHSDNTTGAKGVTRYSQNKWRARICINYKSIHLGLFDSIEDATKAYAEASKKYHGEFGKLDI